MAKHNKNRRTSEVDNEVQKLSEQNEVAEVGVESSLNEATQSADNLVENSARNAENVKDEVVEKAAEQDTQESVGEEDFMVEKEEQQPVIIHKSGGKVIGLVALLVALAVGGVGHFMANKKFAELDAQLANLQSRSSQITQNVSATAVEMPNFDKEKAQIATLMADYQKSLERITQLEREQQVYTQQINGLQVQLGQLSNTKPAEPTEKLQLSDADFLLNNAVRKMVLDNDIETTKSLLIEADKVLSQVASGSVLAVRDAIKSDLNTLAQVGNVDQNNIMQRVAQLANNVDDLALLDNEYVSQANSSDVSDSIEDWQANLEKSATSFLDHFIRVSDRNKAEEKALIAPNQEIYLRENIRLRLQIAILAVPRQQNELYKQSLEAVATWVRSYFDGETDNVKHFLKEIDDLAELSIYVDAPQRLQSLNILNQLLNKTVKPVEKIEIESEKVSEQLKIETHSEAEQPAKAEQQ